MRRPAHSPADDAAGKDVDDRGHVDEALPGDEWSKERMRFSFPNRTWHLSAHTALCLNQGPGRGNPRGMPGAL